MPIWKRAVVGQDDKNGAGDKRELENTNEHESDQDAGVEDSERSEEKINV